MRHHDTLETGRSCSRGSERRCLRRVILGFSGFAAGIILISWIAVGSIILLDSIEVVDAGIGELWPVILILAGANLLLTGGRYRYGSDGNGTDSEPGPMAREEKGETI